ncbi:MAG: hypothetical protein JXB19_07340, partial [Bacteroidales bacterium]|nr:hypothetical protein [Bacteroidales bacterium]
ISGHYQKDGMVHPCYWKNGVLVDLDCDRTAYTSDVFILGDDVYVAGHHLQSDDITIPCFWKNGIKTDLEVPGTMSGYTKSVAADGQNSFITGFLISSGNEENQINACYWKNGELVQLNTSPYKFSIASEIILSGDATYFAGRLDDTEKECLCVWKNDSRIDYLTIPNKTSGTMFFFTWENADYGNFSYEVGVVRHKIGINSMGVYDGDIYITAEQDGNACYWMNENMTVLTEDCEDVSPDYLLVVDQNILIVGNCDKTICVWENGNKREITKLNENERPSYYGLLRK